MALVLLACHGVASAQPSGALDPRALTLFEEARELMREGKYGAACPKLEESLRVQRGIGTLYNLADCHAKLGHTASAWADFREAAAMADQSGQSERAQAARERASALEPSLSKLRVEVTKEAAALPGIEVRRDGVALARESWGVDAPLDPGNYRVSAAAPGRVPWSTVIVVKEPGKTVTVSVPALAIHRGAGGVEGERRNVIPAILLAGGGVAALSMGAGLTGAANAKSADSVLQGDAITSTGKLCPHPDISSQCDELLATLDAHDRFHDGAVAAFVTGGALIIGAAVYLLWPEPKVKPGVLVQPIISSSERGVGIVGKF